MISLKLIKVRKDPRQAAVAVGVSEVSPEADLALAALKAEAQAFTSLDAALILTEEDSVLIDSPIAIRYDLFLTSFQ